MKLKRLLFHPFRKQKVPSYFPEITHLEEPTKPNNEVELIRSIDVDVELIRSINVDVELIGSIDVDVESINSIDVDVESINSIDVDVESTPSIKLEAEDTRDTEKYTHFTTSSSNTLATRKVPKLNLQFQSDLQLVDEPISDSTPPAEVNVSAEGTPKAGPSDVFDSAQYPANSYRSNTDVLQKFNLAEQEDPQSSEELIDDPYAPASILYRAECRVSMTPREVSHCLIGYKDWPSSDIGNGKISRTRPGVYSSEKGPIKDGEELDPPPAASLFWHPFSSVTGWIRQLTFGCCWSQY